MVLPIVTAALAALSPVEGTDPAPAILSPGTITIDSATAAAVPDETSRTFEDAVRRAMLHARFTPLPGRGHGRYAATVRVTRTSRGVVSTDRAAAPPPLASLNGSVTLALPPGGGRLSDLVVTTLQVVIARRSDAQVVWSGSAVTARVTGTRAGAVDVVAQTLADAVLAQFPRQAGGTLSIP